MQRLDMSGMPHEESKPVFMVYRYDEIAQVLRDNETFSSCIIVSVFGDVARQARHARDGRARAPPAPRAGLQGVHAEGAGAPGGRARRAGRQRADRPVRRRAAAPSSSGSSPSRIPTQIIAGLLGLPRDDYPQFQRWSISLLSFTVNRERGIAASNALKEYFAPILAARREEPRDDLISTLAQAEIDGERLSDEEIFSFLRLLLPAGVETTYRSTGNLLFGLLSNPEQLDAVRSDRSLHPAGDRGGGPLGGAAPDHHARGHAATPCSRACRSRPGPR